MLVVGPRLAETEEHTDKHQNRTETKTMAHRALSYPGAEFGSIDNSMTGVIGLRLARSLQVDARPRFKTATRPAT